MTENFALPVVDFEGFGDGTSQEALEIGKQLFEACRDVGFAYLVNTGISLTQVDEMFSWSRRFFSLPSAVKQRAPHPKEGWKQRGYSGIGVEQLSQMVTYFGRLEAHASNLIPQVFDPTEVASIRKQTPDFKESFDIGRSDSQHVENIWLSETDLPGFRDAALSFFHRCREFQLDKLMKALSLGLGLPGNFLAQYHQDGDNQLRLLHYPAALAEVFSRGEKGRSVAHTDFGTATILFQDDVSGLEVESPHGSGQFVPVPPMRDSMVFNVGDLLMRWSNDNLKSTLHRVRAPPDDGTGAVKERYSIPFFMGADVNTVIDCLPGCWSEDRPKKYEPITAGAYIDMRLTVIYA